MSISMLFEKYFQQKLILTEFIVFKRCARLGMREGRIGYTAGNTSVCNNEPPS